MMWPGLAAAALLLAAPVGVGAPHGGAADAACPSGLSMTGSPALLGQRYCASHYAGGEWTRSLKNVGTPPDMIDRCEAECVKFGDSCQGYTVGASNDGPNSDGYCRSDGDKKNKCGQCWLKGGGCTGDSLKTAQTPANLDGTNEDFGYNPATRVWRSRLCPNCTMQPGVCHSGELGATADPNPNNQNGNVDLNTGPALGLHMLRSTPEECCALCSATPGCYAWSFVGVDFYNYQPPQSGQRHGSFSPTPDGQKMCYLKSGCDTPQTFPGQPLYDDAVSGWAVQCHGAPAPHTEMLHGVAGDVCDSAMPDWFPAGLYPLLPGSPTPGQADMWCPGSLTKSKQHKAKCRPGFFQLSDDSTKQYTCSDEAIASRPQPAEGSVLHVHGEWVPVNGPLVCVRCQSEPPAEHTERCDGSRATCQPRCLTGYAPVQPGSEYVLYTCSAGDRWTPVGPPIVCVPITCGRVLPVAHAEQAKCNEEMPHIDRTDANGHTTPASTCNVTCDPGYKPKAPQRPRASRTYTCECESGTVGHWEGGREAYECVSDCPVGHELAADSMSGNVTCTPCPEGHFANGAEPCKACSELYKNRVTSKDQGSCETCGIGNGPNELQSGCEQCPEGKKSSTDEGSCEDCGVLGSSDDRSRCGSTPRIGAMVALGALVLSVMLCLLCFRKRGAAPRMDKASVLRQSLLGGSRELPENILAEKVRLRNSVNDRR
jgi:hypothetical protein